MVLKPTVGHQDCCCRPNFYYLGLLYYYWFTNLFSLRNLCLMEKQQNHLTHIEQIGINAQIEALVLYFFIGK